MSFIKKMRQMPRSANGLGSASYADLLKLQLDSPELYRFLLCQTQREAVRLLREKPVIRMAFVLSSISTWVGDALFQLFLDDPRFDVTAVIVWQKNMDRAHEASLAIDHFRAAGLPYTLGTEATCAADYDVLFYCAPYIDLLEGAFDTKDIPLTSLVCYTGYGFMLAQLEQWQFNLPIHNICWRHFIHANTYRDIAIEFCGIGDEGMVYSGYSKLDPIVEPNRRRLKPSGLWNVIDVNACPKKIIYAPHHSIADVPYYSTFQHNHQFMLDYAKSHPDTTSWIIKPHPLLRISSVKAGIFPSSEAYDAYLEQWNQLPNASVLDGEYITIFPESDCMILDSVSFMAEYLYVHKPILFLTRAETAFNTFGRMIYDVLYHADGQDYTAIDAFIQALGTADPMKQQRQSLFSEDMDYYGQNHITATQCVYNSISSQMKKRTWPFTF